MIEHSGGRPSELLLRADTVCVRGRQLFEKLIREEQSAASKPVASQCDHLASANL